MLTHRWPLLLALALAWSLLPGISHARRAHHMEARAHHVEAPPLTADSVNAATFSDASARAGPVMLRAQILLDRNGISPGLLDAKDGENARNAIGAFQAAHRLQATGRLDPDTWSELTRGDDEPMIVEYTITEHDVHGPFVKHIPADLGAMSKLPHLSYTSPLDLLAEKFHVSPQVLQRLNPGKRFDAAGTAIVVPNVGPRPTTGHVATIEVDKSTKDVRALGENGELIAFYPASVGSEEKPAPTGRYKVRKIVHDPTYEYNPKFQFKGAPDRKVTVAPGPRNPVGAVWIALSKPSYGIHGTPDPAKIGKTQSHGCVRLTNWDALDLANRVRPGTPVDFLDRAPAPEGAGVAQGRE